MAGYMLECYTLRWTLNMPFDLITAIQAVGFPAAMCFYFVVKVEKTINNNTKALQEVKIAMVSCKRK